MKKTGLIVLLLAAMSAVGQNAEPSTVASAATPDNPSSQGSVVETNKNFPNVQISTPNYADINCAGFVSQKLVPNANFIAGGLQSPQTTKYIKGDIVYLAGPGYQSGQQYEIVRELRDINEFEMYPGQKKLVHAAGQPYAELGRVKVLDTRQRNAIAIVEYACDTMLPGDVAIPFAEKPTVTYHPPEKFDRFAPASGKLTGRIVLAKDFDAILGTGAKVYMNVGANQGVKVGDYFRAVRSYAADEHDPVDALSFKATIGEDTQKKPPVWEKHMWDHGTGPQIHVGDMPRRAVGQVVIIGVTPTTSTGMITFALEDVHIGDGVELDNESSQ
jgi:hypothetical protein